MSAQLFGGVSTRSRNGAPSRRGCVVNGRVTKASNKLVPSPPTPHTINITTTYYHYDCYCPYCSCYYILLTMIHTNTPPVYTTPLSRHFLSTYPRLVTRCRVTVKEDTWNRVIAPDSTGKEREHDHAFVKGGPHFMYGRSEGTRDDRGLVTVRTFGGVKGLTLFKTTQSSFTDFHKDNHTSLPEATDRSVLKEQTWTNVRRVFLRSGCRRALGETDL